VYVVTDERFFERAGLLRRTGHDLPLQGVSDVVVAQSLAERLLGSGTLRVITDGGGEVVVLDVPAISRVQHSLLAVADDITQRLRAPRSWADADEEADDVDGPDGPDGPAPPPVPDRAEARRREQEARRRLREIQDRVRRTPVPDPPLEDGGGDDERTPGDDAGGARILRFPPRP
jgi:Bacterial PH domain